MFPSISVLILTKNEEVDLPACLASISWCDDIHVYDSFSTDHTISIAKNFGAHIRQRTFDNYSSQRNAALYECNFKYEWIFILDADERISEYLKQEIEGTLSNVATFVSGFRIRRRDYLNGTWLKHAQITPYYIRLIRKGKASYSREINEVIEVEGQVLNLSASFDHYPFSKGITHWLTKHNDYSSREAERVLQEKYEKTHFSISKAFFADDLSQKRYHQKGLYYKLPFRPVLKLVYLIIYRKAFLDGSSGLTYAFLQSIYEYFIVLKTKELQLKNKSLNNGKR